MNLAMFSAVFCCFWPKGPQSVSAQCRDVLFSASSLTQSKRSCCSAAGERQEHAYKARENRTVAWCKGKGPHGGCFSIGSAPRQASRNLTLKSVVAKPRQDYKDPVGVSPSSSSCALLFLPFGLLVSFRCYGRVCLIPRLTLSSG